MERFLCANRYYHFGSKLGKGLSLIIIILGMVIHPKNYFLVQSNAFRDKSRASVCCGVAAHLTASSLTLFARLT